MKNNIQKFFLAANSCEGFVSRFDDSFKSKDFKAYLIKGGPGTGKSSLMKYLTAKADDYGTSAVLCPCSSDPLSLDAVIFPELKTAVLDATSPHSLEPKLPGALEQIINLGEFWDDDALYKKREKIKEASDTNRKFHKIASGYLRGCEEILDGILGLSTTFTDQIKVSLFAEKTAKSLLKPKTTSGSEEIRFLQGVTPLGIVTYSDTIDLFYENKIIVSDNYGSVAPLFMEVCRKTALDYGYDIITVKNAFLPKKIADHILIPELSLAFVTENSIFKLKDKQRRIHARRFCDTPTLSACRQKLLFRKRLAKELIIAACETLALAKQTHDILEKYYIDAMDFESVTLYADRLAQKIFK